MLSSFIGSQASERASHTMLKKLQQLEEANQVLRVARQILHLEASPPPKKTLEKTSRIKDFIQNEEGG